jgi:tetratricopeptide (TPR) repeat protein
VNPDRRIIRLFLAACLMLVLSGCAARRSPFEEGGVSRVVTHVVAEGETWRSIAYDYYGREGRAEALASYNGIEPGRQPEPGSGIKIPLSESDLKSIEKSKRAVSLYNRGLESLAGGDFAGAVGSFRSAIKLDHNLYDAYFNLAVTYQRMSLHGKAVTILKDLIIRSGSSPDYYYALGNSQFYSGDYGSAEKAFRKALRLDPEHAKSVFSLGMLYSKRGDTAEAVKTWKRYLELDPDSAWADRARAHLESAAGDDGSGR